MPTNPTKMREGGGAPDPCFLLNHHHTLGLRVDRMFSCSNAHSTRKMQATSCITRTVYQICCTTQKLVVMPRRNTISAQKFPLQIDKHTGKCAKAWSTGGLQVAQSGQAARQMVMTSLSNPIVQPCQVEEPGNCTSAGLQMAQSELEARHTVMTSLSNPITRPCQVEKSGKCTKACLRMGQSEKAAKQTVMTSLSNPITYMPPYQLKESAALPGHLWFPLGTVRLVAILAIQTRLKASQKQSGSWPQ